MASKPLDPAQLKELAQRLEADPTVQQMLRDPRLTRLAPRVMAEQITQYARAQGWIPTDSGLKSNAGGGAYRDPGWTTGDTVLVIAAFAGGALGAWGAAAAAGGGAAGASGAGAGTGAGAGAGAGAGLHAAVPASISSGGVSASVPLAAAAGGGGGGGGGGSWLSTLFRSDVLPVAGSLIGTKMQANAMRDASQTESDFLNRALEYQKEQDAYNRTRDEERQQYSRDQFNRYSEGLTPYRDAGVAGVGRAEGALTSSRYRPDLGQLPTRSMGGGSTGTVAMADSAGMVRQVSPDQVADLERRGARRV